MLHLFLSLATTATDHQDTTAALAGGGAAAVGAGVAWLRKRHHRHAHETVEREGERFGWSEERRAHEVKSLKKRHGLRARLARKLRRR